MQEKIKPKVLKDSTLNHISEFPVDIDQLSEYGAARVTAYCFCKVIFIEGVYMLTFHFRVFISFSPPPPQVLQQGQTEL